MSVGVDRVDPWSTVDLGRTFPIERPRRGSHLRPLGHVPRMAPGGGGSPAFAEDGALVAGSLWQTAERGGPATMITPVVSAATDAAQRPW